MKKVKFFILVCDLQKLKTYINNNKYLIVYLEIVYIFIWEYIGERIFIKS